MRGHREGTRRKDGRWQTVRSVAGRERCFVSRKGESLRELTARADRAAYESRPGALMPDMEIARAVGLFLEARKGAPIAGSTRKDGEFAGRLLASLLGSCRVGSLDPFAVDSALASLAHKPRTAQKLRAFGRMLYRWLRKRGWTERDPFSLSSPVRYEPEVWEEPMPAEDFDLALAHVGDAGMRALLLLLRWTAMRPKAARELTWFEVRDDGQRMYVVKASAKSRAGRRPVLVRPEAADAVRALPRSSAFVFPSTSGRRATWSETHLLAVWKGAQAKAGLAPRKVYDLKHLRVTELCEAADGDAGLVARIVGVSSPSVIERHYRQFRQRDLDAVALKKP